MLILLVTIGITIGVWNHKQTKKSQWEWGWNPRSSYHFNP